MFDQYKNDAGDVRLTALKEAAYKLNRKAQVELDDLYKIRALLAGNELALQHLGAMLDYANKLLTQSENERTSHYDTAAAIVVYGNVEFIFLRM